MEGAHARKKEGAILRTLAQVPIGGALPLGQINEELRDRFGFAKVGSYRAVPNASGFALELCELSQLSAAQQEIWRRALGVGSPVMKYDPLRPAASQRNRALSATRLFKHRHAPDRPDVVVLQRMGLGPEHCEQVRMLVCDGPLLLAWIGGFRPRPFAAKELRAFDRLGPALHRAFALDRKLRDAALATAGLSAALERIAASAFIATEAGLVDHANTIARERLDAAPGETRRRVATEIDAFKRGAPTNAEVAEITGAGFPPRWLVLLRDPDRTLQARITAAASAWKLTHRQIAVLSRLAHGDANKTIAHRLGCAEVTIELHVSALLRKAHAASRTELVSRLWTLT